MADFVFTEAANLIATGQLDLREAGSDLRLLLLGQSSSAGSEPDVMTLAGFTTLDEVTGTGYSRQQLANQTVTKDDANNRAIGDCDDVVYAAIDVGTAIGALIYLHVTDDSDSIPICHLDTGFPLVTNGGPVTLRVNTAGFINVTSPNAP